MKALMLVLVLGSPVLAAAHGIDWSRDPVAQIQALGGRADVATPSASSQPAPLTAPVHGTFFDQLLKYYEQGQLPSEAEMIGWRSGRFYSAAQPNEPQQALLLAEKGGVKAHGPLFSGIEQDFTFALIQKFFLGPDRFDRLSVEDRQSVQKWLDDGNVSSKPVAVSDQGELSVGDGSAKVSARMYKDFILLKYSCLQVVGECAKVGDVFGMAYHFSPDLRRLSSPPFTRIKEVKSSDGKLSIQVWPEEIAYLRDLTKPLAEPLLIDIGVADASFLYEYVPTGDSRHPYASKVVGFQLEYTSGETRKFNPDGLPMRPDSTLNARALRLGRALAGASRVRTLQ